MLGCFPDCRNIDHHLIRNPLGQIHCVGISRFAQATRQINYVNDTHIRLSSVYSRLFYGAFDVDDDDFPDRLLLFRLLRRQV
ncbi:hypothetical protein SDC9_115712 [bioreactor metagenome]|uniref:Uncharacterized protein n=1 Tax=bioreactor metagenome TaxID=1076179 RepID=A0A645BUM8_9ZZZZ